MTDDDRRTLIVNYHTWLNMELRYLNAELGQGMDRCIFMDNTASMYHWVDFGSPPMAPPMAPPTSRAAAVLDAVGCDWRNDIEHYARRAG